MLGKTRALVHNISFSAMKNVR